MGVQEKNNKMEHFKSLLKKHSLKATPQRLAVHEAMLELGHASVDMVTEAVAKTGKARVTVASVYNILSGLAQLGIYSHRMSANNKMYFDVNSYRHIHIYDRENNVFADVSDNGLLEVVENCIGGRRFRGYKIEDVDIQIIVRPTRRRAAVSNT